MIRPAKPPILSAPDLGRAIRAERRALGKTQAALAAEVGCRRQTIADLEAGRNVSLRIVMAVMAGLGKQFQMVSARPDMDRVHELLDDPDEDQAP